MSKKPPGRPDALDRLIARNVAEANRVWEAAGPRLFTTKLAFVETFPRSFATAYRVERPGGYPTDGGEADEPEAQS